MNLLKALLVSSILSPGIPAIAENVIWQNDFEKTETLNSGVCGLPVRGFSCRGMTTNRSHGDKGDLKIIYKGLSDEQKFSGKKSLKLAISANKSSFVYFKSDNLKTKIPLTSGMVFSGYLYKSKDIPAKNVVKVCPRFESVRLNDKKKVSIEYRIGGFSPQAGLSPQSKENWFHFSAEMEPVISGICRKKNYSLKDTFFVGWSLLINGAVGEKSFVVFVDDVKLINREDPRKRNGKNIAGGRPYIWNSDPNAFPHGYQGDPMCKDPGDKKQLTNGRLASRCWFDRETVGWWQENKPVNITIDLGKTLPVNTVMIHLSSEADGKRVPSLIRVFTTDDNKNFHLAGEMEKKDALNSWLGTNSAGSMDGNPQGWVLLNNLNSKGRYVTLSLESSALYLDEICVFSGNLKADKIKLPRKRMYNDIRSVTPFYKHRSAAVATEVITPMHIKEYDRKPLDLYLDLPEGLAPAGKSSQPAEIKVEGIKYKRYTIRKAREIYIKTTLAAGQMTKIQLTGMKSAGDLAGVVQQIPIEIISIPAVKPFKKLITNVGFAGFDYWQRWPDVVKNYKHLGLNLFTPFSHNDYYYRMWKRQDRNVLEMIKEAKQAGLLVGGNYSPFCNAQINDSSLTPRKAVYIDSETRSNVNCPRVYTEQYLKNPDNQDINSVIQGFKNGLDIMFLDSEPHWSGKICACSKCDKLWREFLKAKKAKSISIKQAAALEPDLLQQFWNEFYIELWRYFKSAAQKAAGGKAVKIGVYGCPGMSTNYRFGNNTSFAPVYKANALDFANPSLYSIITPELGKAVKRVIANNPAGAPFYVWLTGGGSSLTFERTPAEFKNRVYEVFMNGAKGIVIWTALGFNTREYQAFAKAISILQPYEEIIYCGKAVKAFSCSDKAVQLTGLTLDGKTLLLVTRYGVNKPGKVTVKSTGKFRKATILTGGKLTVKSSSLIISFDGSEEDYTQLLLIDK